MIDGLVAMVQILGAIESSEVPELVGPVVESELALAPRSFTELVQGILAAEIPGIAQRQRRKAFVTNGHGAASDAAGRS